MRCTTPCFAKTELQIAAERWKTSRTSLALTLSELLRNKSNWRRRGYLGLWKRWGEKNAAKRAATRLELHSLRRGLRESDQLHLAQTQKGKDLVQFITKLSAAEEERNEEVEQLKHVVD
jgi:hypothetical protein